MSVSVTALRGMLLTLAMMLALTAPWASAEESPSLSRLLIASGVDAQMPVFGKMVQGTLAQNPALADGEQQAVLQHIAMESFRGDVIYRRVEAAVAEALQSGDLETLMLWYNSPLGKRITELELKGLETDALAAMRDAAESLMADQPRLASAARLDDLTQSTQLGMTLQQRAMLASYMAESIAANPDAKVDTAALDAQLKAHQQPMRELIQQQTLLSLAFTYRDLPLDKIASYESFLATSAAQRYQQGLQNGVLRGIDVVLESWESGLREH